MNIDPLLIRALRMALLYGVGAFLYFHFLRDDNTLVESGVKSAATAGVFMLLYYVTARILRKKSE